MIRLIPAALTGITFAASAAEPSPGASAGNLIQILLGLVVVLAVFAGVAWSLKRIGLAKTQSGTSIKIVGGINVGSRERILVVEVADQWIVVGVAPGRVNTLSTMPRQEDSGAPQDAPAAGNFASWLKQTIEKRHGNQA